MSDDFSIKVDAKDALDFFERFGRQAPFAVSVALNRTAEEFLIFQRRHVASEFTLKTPVTRRFLIGKSPANASRINKNTGKLIQTGGRWQATGHIVQEPREVALKRRLFTRVKVRPPTRKPRHTLSQFEKGGTYSHAAGVPLPGPGLRSSSAAPIARKWYPKSLGLMSRRGIGGATSRVVLGRQKGKRKTYRVRSAEGREFIFKRTGKGFGKSKLLWEITRKRLRIPTGLDFVRNARKVVARRWRANMRGAIVAAKRTAIRR